MSGQLQEVRTRIASVNSTQQITKAMKMVDKKYVRYDNHDEHTFWYKIKMNENEKFSYSFKSLDKQDNYDLYFYQYDGTNFCRSLIQNNLEMISFERQISVKVKLKTRLHFN